MLIANVILYSNYVLYEDFMRCIACKEEWELIASDNKKKILSVLWKRNNPN